MNLPFSHAARCTLHPAPCTLALLAACTPEPVPVAVNVRLAEGEPAVGIEVRALPYDAPSLLDSLARAYPEPRPDFGKLEARLLTYVPAPAADLGPAGRAWTATRDSAQRLADSLRRADRDSPGYRTAYTRFRALYRRLTERTSARDEVYRSVTAESRDLAEEAARAADALRAWEARAYAPFDSLAALALQASERAVVADTSGRAGRAELELEPGSWWLVVRVRHRVNPFAEHAWEIPVTVRGYWPIRVPLFAGNEEVRWRH